MLGALKVLKLWLCLKVVFFDRSFLKRGVQRFIENSSCPTSSKSYNFHSATVFLFRQEGTQLHTDPAGAFLLSHAVVGKGAMRNEQTEPVTTGGAKFFQWEVAQ
jgi:hypothetical protein